MTQYTCAPAVSVIMPAYNAARFIDDAIASVLKQSVADLELVVVDDGSADATTEIVKAWIGRDDRVRLVGQPNRGVSAARNRAMAVSRGRYLAFLDSDDEWAPDFVAVQLRVLERMPWVGVVTGNAYERGGPNDGRPLRPRSAMLRHLLLQDLIEDESSVCVMSVFRRDVLETIGGLDERLHRSEDYQFWLRAVCAGFGIVQTPELLGWYRRRPDGASADELAMLDSITAVLAETRARCAEQPEIVDLIDRQLLRFERERLVLNGKAALLAGAFADATEAFTAASLLDGSAKLRAVAIACRVAPRSLRAVYSRRSSAARPAST